MNREGLSLSSAVFAMVIFLIVPGVAAGLVAGSFWAGLLIFCGLLFAAVSASILQSFSSARGGIFYLLALLTLVCFFFAGRLAGWQPFWLWMLFSLPGFLYYFLGSRHFAVKQRPGLQVLVLVLAFVVLLMPLGGYYWLTSSADQPASSEAPAAVQPAPEEQSEPEIAPGAVERASAVGNYVPPAERSFWGKLAVIVWLAVLAYLFYGLCLMWFGLKARYWPLILLFIGSLVLSLAFPAFHAEAAPFIYSGPVFLIQLLLDFSISTWNNAGWGLLLLGVGLSLVLLPVRRRLLSLQDFLVRLGAQRRQLGTTIFGALVQKEYRQQMIGTANAVALVFGLLLLVSAWLALLRISPPPLPFYFIPDLASPSFWPPALHWAHLALGVVMALSAFSYARAAYHLKLSAVAVASNSGVMVTYLLGGLLAALFIPAGVLLYALGDTLMRLLFLGLMAAGQPQIHAAGQRVAVSPPYSPKPAPPMPAPPKPVHPKPVPPKPEQTKPAPPNPEPTRPVPPRPEQTKPAPLNPEPTRPAPPIHTVPASPVRLLFQTPETAADVVPYDTHLFLTLLKDGRLTEIKRGAAGKAHGLPLPSPLGLVKLTGQQLLAVGVGRLVFLDFAEEGISIGESYQPGVKISCFALNPYRTMLAYGSEERGAVCGLFLSGQREQIYARDLPAPRALAFSGDGRYLATGTQSGEVFVFDIATGLTARSFIPQAFDPSPVDQLCAGPAGCWVVAYAGKELSCWDAQGSLRSRTRLTGTVTAMAVDPESGRIAYGSRSGYLRVSSAELKDELFNQKVVSGSVRKLIWEEAGTLLVLADSSLRRVEL
jgi:Ca2+/Na+ antiporter